MGKRGKVEKKLIVLTIGNFDPVLLSYKWARVVQEGFQSVSCLFSSRRVFEDVCVFTSGVNLPFWYLPLIINNRNKLPLKMMTKRDKAMYQLKLTSVTGISPDFIFLAYVRIQPKSQLGGKFKFKLHTLSSVLDHGQQHKRNTQTELWSSWWRVEGTRSRTETSRSLQTGNEFTLFLRSSNTSVHFPLFSFLCPTIHCPLG